MESLAIVFAVKYRQLYFICCLNPELQGGIIKDIFFSKQVDHYGYFQGLQLVPIKCREINGLCRLDMIIDISSCGYRFRCNFKKVFLCVEFLAE